MIAISKGFDLPAEFLLRCDHQGLIATGYGDNNQKFYMDYARLLNKKLIFQPIDLRLGAKEKMKLIRAFVDKHGVSGISSSGHIKVVDNVIKEIQMFN